MHRARIGDEGAALNRIGPNIALAMAAALFATMVLTHLSYPLIWEDESDSVMFGQRILRFGYPKVHDEKNTLYGLKDKLEIGVDPETDAYTGAPWVNYYVGAIGVALAEQVDDVYEKTFRVRLPYTLIGFAGLILLFVAVAPAMGASRGAKQRAAFTYLLMLCVSISLILHLREARYYPIVLLQYGALVYAFVRHHFYEQLSFGRYVAISFVSLFLLFNTFYPAFGVWCIATSIFLGLRALQRNEPFASKVASLLRTNAPVFIATATVLPLLLYFDFAVQADRWFDQFGSSVAAYGYNLWIVLFNMLRFEFLVPALVLKAALVVLRFSHPTSRTDLRAGVSTSNFLATLLFCYWLVVSRSPFIFERYFLTMGPLITIMVLIDGHILYERLCGLGGKIEKFGLRSGTALALILAAAVLFVRAPEIEGRVYEMRHQYKGPVDYFVPYILEKYEHPEDLVVATNYAEPVSMFYLGSHVTVGFYGTDLDRDLTIQPDIIVPRPWKRNLEALEILAAGATYEIKSFEVKNQMTNNTPALSPYSSEGLKHRYKTVLATTARERLNIFELVPRRAR